MLRNKKLVWLIALLVILILIIIWIFSKSPSNRVQYNDNQNTGKQNISNQNSSTQADLTATANNFVKCDIDGKKIDFKMIDVIYYKSMKSTTLLAIALAENSYSASIQLGFPNQQVGIFKDIEKDTTYGMIYGESVTASYQSFLENGGTQVNVTKYSGNNIEGTFSATGIHVDTKGTDPSRKHLFNCSFSSNSEIKVQ